jgi:imidazolonepropionase
MWDDLWFHAHIATMEPGSAYGAIENGAIAVEDGKIAWIGPAANLPASPARCADRVHDARGRLITPGLIDPHTHLIYAGNRANEFEARLNGASYAQIARQGGGIRSTVAATRETPENALFDAAADRVSEMLRNGTTTIEVKSGYGLDLAGEQKQLRVARQLGERFAVDIRVTYLAAHALPAGETDADAYIEFVCREALPAIVRAGLADAVDAFCESVAFTPAQTARVFEAASALGMPVKLHADQLSDGGGAALAAEFNALSADHLEYTSLAGVKALAAAHTVAVLLPGAYYFLRERRKPPVRLLRRHGVPMALATDCNPGTSPITSLPLVMNLACTLFRLTPAEALAGVTRNAAQALGIGKRRGTLREGKAADFVLWEAEQPAELSYYVGRNRCIAVVKDGRIIHDTRRKAREVVVR